MLTHLDGRGKSFEAQLPERQNRDGEWVREKSLKLTPTRVEQVCEGKALLIENFVITEFKNYPDLKAYHEQYQKPYLHQFDYREQPLKVHTPEAVYYLDADRESLIKEKNGVRTPLGNGKIAIKSSYKRATKTREARIEITVALNAALRKRLRDHTLSPRSGDQ